MHRAAVICLDDVLAGGRVRRQRVLSRDDAVGDVLGRRGLADHLRAVQDRERLGPFIDRDAGRGAHGGAQVQESGSTGLKVVVTGVATVPLAPLTNG